MRVVKAVGVGSVVVTVVLAVDMTVVVERTLTISPQVTVEAYCAGEQFGRGSLRATSSPFFCSVDSFNATLP